MQSMPESEVMTAGPVLEVRRGGAALPVAFQPLRQALMQLCHEGASLMALRTASRSFCGAAERRGPWGP